MNIGRWLEEDFYLWGRNIRDVITYPIVRALAALGIHPDVLTYVGIISMLGFVYFVGHDPKDACLCLAFTLAMDSIDGALARHLHTQSDKGKFVDVFADSLNFTLFVIGLLHASLVTSITAILYTYFMVVVRILLIIRKNIHKESDWLIRPAAGCIIVTSIGVPYFLFLVYTLTGQNYLEIASLFFVCVLIIETLIEYRTIRISTFAR